MPDTAFARRNVEKVLWIPRYALGDLVTRVVPRSRDTWVVGSAYGVHDGARALVEELVARGRGDRVTWLARSEQEATDAREPSGCGCCRTGPSRRSGPRPGPPSSC